MKRCFMFMSRREIENGEVTVVDIETGTIENRVTLGTFLRVHLLRELCFFTCTISNFECGRASSIEIWGNLVSILVHFFL